MTNTKNQIAELPAILICYLLFAICDWPEGQYDLTSITLTWRNWQTRTAQDRMGKPVEVRVLS
jgi:hypothetical protein